MSHRQVQADDQPIADEQLSDNFGEEDLNENSQANSAQWQSHTEDSKSQSVQILTTSQSFPAPVRGDEDEQEQQDENFDQEMQIYPRIADLPWDEKFKQYKTFLESVWANSQVGDYIDAIDSINKWCLAQIVYKDENVVKVHYDGWSSKWDIMFKWSSYKISPFRRYSKGYTGQIKMQLRSDLIFTVEDCLAELAQLKKFIKSDFLSLNAYAITQYVRGKVFIYVDFLLSQQMYTNEQSVVVIRYLKTVIQLCVAWMRKIKCFMSRCFSDYKKENGIYMVDEEVSLVMCCHELMGMLSRIFCGCHRCLKFYLYCDHNQEPLDLESQVYVKDYTNINFVEKRMPVTMDLNFDDLKRRVNFRDSSLVFGTALNLMAYFSKIGGFEAYLDLLKDGNERPIETEHGKPIIEKDLMPLEMIGDLINVFLNSGLLLNPEFAAKFVSQIQEIVVSRLIGMKDKEIKELDNDSLLEIQLQLKMLLSIAKDENQIAQLIENVQLQFAVRYLKTSYLEKRLQGVADIKSLIERVDAIERLDVLRQKAAQMGQRQSNYIIGPGGKKIEPTRILSPETLKDWIVNQKIAEVLFDENSHPEIIKRSGPVIKFLCQHNALTPNLIDLIWKCQQGKHEETVRIVYNLINEVANELSPLMIENLFAKIAAVPSSQHSEMYITFLKEFTANALSQDERIRAYNKDHAMEDITDDRGSEFSGPMSKEVKIFENLQEAIDQPSVCLNPSDKLFGLPLLWDLIQDSYKCDDAKLREELMKVSLDSFVELIVSIYSSNARLYFMVRSLQNLKNGVSLYPSIQVLMSILKSFDSSQEETVSCKKAVLMIENQLSLVKIILGDLTQYNEVVKESLKQLGKKGKVPQKPETLIFAGRTEHQYTLDKLFEMLQYLVFTSDSEVTIGTQNINQLWQMFAQSPNLTFDLNTFINLINKKLQQTQTEYTYGKPQPDIFLFTPAEQKYLFTSILCNRTFVDYSQMSIGMSKCFQNYFRLINKSEGHIQYGVYKRQIIVDNFEQLVGIDSLWSICEETENEKVRDEGMDLLISLHLRLNRSFNFQDKRKIVQGFVQRSMLNLQTALKKDKPERKILNTVKILSSFLDIYDGTKPIKPEFRNFYGNQSGHTWNNTVILIKNQTQQDAKVSINQFETLGSVRAKCAQAFGLDLNEFMIKLSHSDVDPDEDDDKYVKDFGMSQQIYLIYNINYDKQGHPKFILSRNQEYFELLFSLLAMSNANIVEPVWQLLQKLPVNAQLQNDIRELHGAEQGWDKLLDSHSTHRLLYSLKIIQDLTLGGNSNESLTEDDSQKFNHWKWKKHFIETGGFNHLLTSFSELNIERIESNLTLNCISDLLSIILDFVALDSNLQIHILERKKPITLTCLKFIKLISIFTLEQEKQRGEPIEDVQLKLKQKKQAKQQMKQLQVQKQYQNQNQEDSDLDESEISNQVSKTLSSFSSSTELVKKLFNFMRKNIIEIDLTALKIVGEYEQLGDLMEIALLKTENFSIRQEVASKFRSFIKTCGDIPDLHHTFTVLVNHMIIQMLPKAQKCTRRCVQYYTQAQRVIEESQVSTLEPLNYELFQLIESLTLGVQTQESQSDLLFEDLVLTGTMNMLRSLLQKYPQKKAQIGAKLVQYLLRCCLFQVPHSAKTMQHNTQPKCKSQNSRIAAFRLLTVLARDCIQNLQQVLDFIKELTRQQSWRTNKTNDWSISHLNDEKSSTGYVGLKNLGCICYMISLFQQLFMVPSFRNDLLSVEDPNHDNNEPDENMFYQLQALFMGLLKSEKQYVSLKAFCHSFKDWEGQPTNVFEQMDVEEFLQMFMDRLETAIKKTPLEKTVQDHFGGKFASEMICKGCPHYYERSEPFLSLGVPVKNKRSLQEGLNATIQGEMLEGDNAYHCAKCDKKVDALKRTCIKQLPRYLIVSLKRFEYDFDRMIRVKINDYCEFPMELDMLPYTQEGLQRREAEATKKKEAAEKGEELPEQAEETPLKYPKSYYEYKLKGVVVHTGTADSGHYYSYIREPEQKNGDKWYEFNDHIVRDFNSADLASECFGGEEFFGMMQMRTQKMRNAYLVLYERKDQEIKPETEEEVQQQPKSVDIPIDTDEQPEKLKLTDINHPIVQKILLENQKFWQNKFLFGQEYFDFINDLTHYWDTAYIVPLMVKNKNNDDHIVPYKFRQSAADPKALVQYILQPNDEVYDLRKQVDAKTLANASHEVFKMAATFYITILQRANNKILVPQIVNALKAYLNHNNRNGKWLISEFTNWKLIQESLLQCCLNNDLMQKLVTGLLYAAMLTVYEDEKHLLANYFPPDGFDVKDDTPLGPLGNFILMLISNMYQVKNVNKNMAHFFQLLARFASLGPEAREFLLRAKMVGRCMDFFFEGSSPYKLIFTEMSDLGNFVTKETPDMGLPTEIDFQNANYFAVMQEKKRIQSLQSGNQKNKYLIETVGLCVKHLKVLGPQIRSPHQIDFNYISSAPITTFVLSQEHDIFIPEAKFLSKFIREAKKNRAMTTLMQAYCHYACQEAEHVEELMRTVEYGLKENDYEGLRPFLYLLETMLSTNHEAFTAKRAAWLERLLHVIKKDGLGYYKWMETLYEFIFKIVGRNAWVREWFYSNVNAWKWLRDWAQQNQKPPHPQQPNQNNVKLYKSRHNIQLASMQQYNDPSTTVKNNLNTAYRMRRITEMLNQTFPDTSKEPNLDEVDFQDFKHLPGDIITLYQRKLDGADQARVLEVLDEMISLQTLEKKEFLKWQKCDSDKILLGDMWRQLSRQKTKQELLELRQAQLSEQRARQVALQEAMGSRNQQDAENDDDMRGSSSNRTKQGPAVQHHSNLDYNSEQNQTNYSQHFVASKNATQTQAEPEADEGDNNSDTQLHDS